MQEDFTDVVTPASSAYVVLSEDYLTLAMQVQNHMEIGWVCQGGVAVFGEPGNARLYQAMVHPEGVALLRPDRYSVEDFDNQ